MGPKTFRVMNVVIALAAVALFGLLGTPVNGQTREPDQSECGSAISVLQHAPDSGGEPRVDDAAFRKSCIHNARHRMSIIAVLTAIVVGLGSFEIVFRRMDPARVDRRALFVRPFRD